VISQGLPIYVALEPVDMRMGYERLPKSKAKLSADDLATLVSTLQTEMLGIKTRLTEREVQVDSMQETIVKLAHENELLKRRRQ